jgi:uncharacterized NAD-dependent epimerase/dehydratase family protein
LLRRDQKLAIYLEGQLTGDSGKMGYGVLRYSPNEVVCVIDSTHEGKNVQEVIDTPRSCPVVGTVWQARELGADVFVLGIAVPGGLIPADWFAVIDEAVDSGMSILNGLHDRLAPKYPRLAEGQWVWDVRVEPEGLAPSFGTACALQNQRVLMIGTDMSVGKMTAGLEIYRAAKEAGVDAEFVATGQIGITVTGRGVPLDAVRVDYAGGAIEREVMAVEHAEMVIIEGQGALIHPGSSANLPLLRGSCPTHLVMCHRAGQTGLRRIPVLPIPPLLPYARLYEDLAEACGTFPRPKTVAVALNTSHLTPGEADDWAKKTEDETGLPAADPIRHGPEKLLQPLLADLPKMRVK